MRLTAWNLLFLSVLSAPALAQPDLVASCDRKFGLCRYLDKQTRQERIPARFERAMPFSEGLAAVRVDGRFGYIDQRGETVIAPRFDLAGEFYQGLAEILVGDKAGVINRAGEIIVPPRFRRAIPLTKNVIVAEEGIWTSSHYEGHEKLGGLQDYFVRGQAGLYNVTGHWIRRPDLKHVGFFEKQGLGLIWASVEGRGTGPVGLLASHGWWVAAPQYDFGGWLTDDRAVVRKRVNGVLLTGAIDSGGRLVVPLRPWALFYWHNGLALAKESYQAEKQGLVDKSGNLVGRRFFDKVERAETGDISAVLIDGRWVGLDRTGKIVPHPRNGRVYATCPIGFRIIEMDGKLQVTDASGQVTIPHLIEPLTRRPTCDRPFAVKLNGKWGFVGLDGRLLFDPPPFDSLHEFEGDHALVKQGAKWGIIDRSGRFVVEPKFDVVGIRRVGLIQVTIEGRQAWVTWTGEERPEPATKYEPQPQLLDCRHGLRLVERDGRWGIVDADGRDIIAPVYRALVCFAGGIAWAPIDARRQWCALGPDGAVRERPACKIGHYPYIVTHSYPERFHDDRFESSVLWTRAYLEFHAGRRAGPPGWVGDGVRGGPSTATTR